MVTLQQISTMWQENGRGLFIILIILASLVQIAPIKINPWNWLFEKLGKAFNKDIAEKIDNQSKELDKVKTEVAKIKKEVNENSATSSRYRILRFDDELLHDIKHTKEHFDQILVDIDVYEKFCERNPDFKNNLAVMAIKHIKSTYQYCCQEQSFL